MSGVGSISQLHSGWSLRFMDYDNDGWKDLLVAEGHDMDNIQLVSPKNISPDALSAPPVTAA